MTVIPQYETLEQVRYDAILFDFEGVLIDSEPTHFLCWTEVLARVGIALEREIYETRLRGLSGDRLLQALCSLRQPAVPMDEMLALYPVKNDLFRDRAFNLDLMSPGVAALIDELTHLPLAVVTSARRSHLYPILTRAGKVDRFGTIVCREDVSDLKPSPEPYLTAASRLGVRSPLVVEDSQAGVDSGRAAGFDVLLITDYGRMPELVRERLQQA